MKSGSGSSIIYCNLRRADSMFTVLDRVKASDYHSLKLMVISLRMKEPKTIHQMKNLVSKRHNGMVLSKIEQIRPKNNICLIYAIEDRK